MKNSQKVKATIESISFETTRDKLPSVFDFLVNKLDYDPAYEVFTTHTNAAGLTLYIALDFIGTRPKAKSKIFGYVEEEFMAKQYK